MQMNQKFNFEVSSKAKLDSQCSCAECDSASCFVKRRATEYCSCGSPATSEFYFIQSNQSSKLVTEIKCSKSKSQIIPQVHIVPDIREKQAEYTYNVVTQQNICEIEKESKKSVITDSTTTIFKISNTSFKQQQSNNGKISSFIQNNSREKSKNDKGSNVYCYRKKAYREGSENVKAPKDAACQNMSAAVNHSLPYQELQAPIPKSKVSGIVNISAVDIYKKIQEAYKACSCEVCECVVGKSLQNEFCKCKPCECNDCANLSECMLRTGDTELMQKHDEQCFCLLCDKKSCKLCDIESKLEDYHGKHEHLKLRTSIRDYQSCDCKPCECMECKARSIHRTLIVAPVGGELQSHNGCRCAPCECFECRHRFGVTTNGQHEISTGVNRHPHCHCEVCDNEGCTPDNHQSCRCVRQSKVMSKPVEQDSHDYDIRTAHVTYNNKGICKRNFETLAMFAALPSSYTKRKEQSNQCTCDYCECLNCEYCINSQFSQKYQLDKEVHGPNIYCKPEALDQFRLKNVSDVDTCDCTDSNYLVHSCAENEMANKKLNSKSPSFICGCNFSEFVDYEKTMAKCVKNRGEDAIVDLITEVKNRRHARLRNNDPLIQSCIDTLELNKIIFQHQLSIHALKSSNSINNFGEPHHPTCHQVSYGSHRMFCPNFETDSVIHEHISTCAYEIDNGRHNKQTLNSSLSLTSSKSLVKESESVTPVTSKLKSGESSCNSSGYDFPDYLAHFPKLTIKTCLDDVMQCDLSNNVIFSMSSNHNIVTKISDFSLHDRKSFQSHTVTARSCGNTKVNFKKPQILENGYQNYVGQIRNLKKEQRKICSKFKINPENEYDKFKTDSASTSITNTSKVTFNEEFIRVQKTLREAREYSLHLVSLFEKYEKANKEFESVSEKIKNSYYSFDRNINKHVNQANKSKSKDTFVVQEVPTKDSESTFKSALDNFDIMNEQINYTDDRHNINSSEKAIKILMTEPFDTIDRGNHDINYAFMKTNNAITEENSLINGNKQRLSIAKRINKRHNQFTKRSRDFVTLNRNISQSSKAEAKQGVFYTVKNDTGNVVTTESQILGNHKHIQESLDIKVISTVKHINGDFHDKKNILEANIPEKLEQEIMIETEDRRTNISDKKDFHDLTLSKDVTENTNLSTKPTTELFYLSESKSIVKPNTESINDNVNMEKNCDKMKHEALDKVQSEVKRLLDLPFLQIIKDHKKKKNYDKNCEALKVTTLIAQRISDHSVAVKWKAPCLFKNVKGYEILIDGRFVQKITNPSRRMAVISCLPHADKVLLTVRTVVAVPVSDHYPAATVVYHTRKKSETLMHSRTSFV